jgi:hypothetical protein
MFSCDGLCFTATLQGREPVTPFMRLTGEKENSIYLDKQFGFFELSIDPAQMADAMGKLGS